MLNFLGVCDRFRKTEEGEAKWQEMMATKKKTSEKKFMELCDVSIILDDGETWREYKDAAKSDPIKFYESANGLYFFQTAGFEFIWGL